MPDELPLLKTGMPTLVLCECVLAYVSPQASGGIFDWFTRAFSETVPIGAIVYEMFGLEDAFGKVMKNNLKVRTPVDSALVYKLTEWCRLAM